MKFSSIGQKIWFSVSILIIGYFITMITGFIQGKSTQSALVDISEALFPATVRSQEALTAFNDEIRLFDDAIMSGDEERLASALESGDEVLTALEAISALEGLTDKMKGESSGLVASITSFNIEAEPIYRSMSQGNTGEALVKKVTDLAKDTDAIKDHLAAFKNGFEENLQNNLSAIGRKTKTQQRLNITIFLVVVIVTLVLIWVIINRFIIQPITGIIGGLNDSSDQLTNASDEIAAASQTLSEATSEQAASLEETSASLGEVASMTRQNEENADHADILTKEATGIVANAKGSMEALTTSMNEITNASQDTSKIIKTIDEIAFQTNLLALNAAVEAARAGEAGAGFAVVADEVRNLAMRAAEAATSTTTLIEDTIAKVNTGNALVAETKEAVMKAEESSNKVSGLISEISTASKEQSRSIEQINAAVTEIDRATQNNAANAEESAAASSEMNAQTTKMRNQIAVLQSIIFSNKENVRRPSSKNLPIEETHHRSLNREPAQRRLMQVISNDNEVKPKEVIPMDDHCFSDF